MAAGLLDGSAGGGLAAVAIADAACWGGPELRSIAAEIAATLPSSHSGQVAGSPISAQPPPSSITSSSPRSMALRPLRTSGGPTLSPAESSPGP